MTEACFLKDRKKSSLVPWFPGIFHIKKTSSRQHVASTFYLEVEAGFDADHVVLEFGGILWYFNMLCPDLRSGLATLNKIFLHVNSNAVIHVKRIILLSNANSLVRYSILKAQLSKVENRISQVYIYLVGRNSTAGSPVLPEGCEGAHFPTWGFFRTHSFRVIIIFCSKR